MQIKARPRRLLATLVSLVLLLTAMPAVSPSSAAAAESYRYVDRWPSPTWHLNEPAAIAFGPDGTTFVADRQNNMVRVYSANAVLLRSWGGSGNTSGKFKNPSGIAVSADGQKVYVVDTGNNRMQSFSAAGTWLRTWGKAGGPDLSGSGPGEFDSPNAVAVDASGDVYVADTGNNRIQKFDAQGNWERQWGVPGTGPGQFYAPWAVAIDGSGNVFVVEGNASYKTSRVQKFTSSGTHIKSWGAWVPAGVMGKGYFRVPKGVACDADGNVYVSDTQGHVVQKFTNDGEFLLQWGGGYGAPAQFSYPGQFKSPLGLGVDPDGDVWVADSGWDRFEKFSSQGQLLSVNGSWGTVGGYFYYAADAAAAPSSGDVYVVSRNSNCLQRFDAEGTYLGGAPRYAVQSSRLGEFKWPTGVAVSKDGYVYVVEEGNNRVQKFASDLTFMTAWGEGLSGTGWFAKPMDVAVGPDGSVYVADTGNNRIQKFTPDGEIITKWGTLGSAVGQLRGPQGVAVGEDGTVWVADTGNHRIQRFDSSGNNPKAYGGLGSAAGKFSSPAGLAVDAYGNVFVADRDNDRVQKFTANGAFIATFGSRGSEAGQLNRPTGVSLGLGGRVYVADKDNHRIEVFARTAAVDILGVTNGYFYNRPVTPEVRYSFETASGATLNGDPWTPGTISTEGRHTITAWASDASYRDEKTVSFTIDLTKPNTTATVNSTYNDAATITLNASDALSGVAKTYYRLDNGSAIIGKSLTVTKAGSHTLKYWSEDRAGNVETAKSATFTIRDTAAPVTTCNAKDRYITSANIALSAKDACGSTPIVTQWSLDGGPAKTGTSVSTSALGTHKLEYRSTDSAGNREATRSVSFSVVKPASLVSVAGSDRYSTAATASRRAFPNGASTVIIASGRVWMDALGGSSLAGAYNAPVLLTEPRSLPEATRREIVRLKASRVVVLGGPVTIESRVLSRLNAIPSVKSVSRIGGRDRYATADMIAAKVKAKEGAAFDRVAFVATGNSFADALTASPIASAKSWPLYLCGPKGLTAGTVSAMRRAGIKRVILIGGTTAVPSRVVSQAKSLGASVQRVGSASRSATTLAVAALGVRENAVGWSKPALTSQTIFTDALGGGVMQGRARSVLLLTPGTRLDAGVAKALRLHREEALELRVLGGTRTVTSGVRSSALSCLR